MEGVVAMDAVNIVFGVSYVAMGLLLIIICIPLLRGAIGPNPWYGVRLPKSFASPEVWYEVNRYGAKQVILWSLPILLLGIICFFVPLKQNQTLAMLLAIAPLVLLVVPAVKIFRFLKSL